MIRNILCAVLLMIALAAGVTAIVALTPARSPACVPDVDC
jgi:hypothetical protein